MKLNCITVDDEPLALNLISGFAGQTPFLELKGKFGNAVEALQALHSEQIHIVFLDIQMPGLNGMDFARVISQRVEAAQTRIIFTTAYNQFAVEGYKVNALDYLLKPFGYDEFLAAANKAYQYFENLPEPARAGEEAPYIFVKSDYKLVRIDLSAITYVESIKDYLRIHLTPPLSPVITLSSMKAMEDRLPSPRFLRIHRSFIVAVGKIDAVGKNAIHIGNTEIPVGDLYKDAFRNVFGKWM